MNDFVTRLEDELHRAALRREQVGRVRGGALPRLRVALRDVPVAAVATVLLGLAVTGVALLLSASPERPANPGMPAQLRGVWQAPPTELRLYARGAERCLNLGLDSSQPCYTIGASASGVASEWGQLSIAQDELTLRATENSAPGVYRWRLQRGALRLTRLDDPLARRARALTTTPLRPVRPSETRARLPAGWALHPYTSSRFGYSIQLPVRWSTNTMGPTDRYSLHPSRDTLPELSVVAHELPAGTGTGRWQVIVNARVARGCARDAWYRKSPIGDRQVMVSRFLGCNGADEQWAIFTHRGRGYTVQWRGKRGRMSADAPLFDALLKTIVPGD
jgi:hypothetical protein